MDLNFGYTIIYVADVAKTVDFYHRAFGLAVKFVHDSGAYSELDTGATTLAFAEHDFATESTGLSDGVRRNRADDLPPGVNLTMLTSDVPAAYRLAVESGATIVKEPLVKPWGQTVGLVRDCNGVLIEIATPVTH